MLLDFKKNGGNFGICSRNFTTKSDKSNSRVVESLKTKFLYFVLVFAIILNNVTILYGQDRLFRFGDKELRSSILLLYIQNYKVI